MIVAFPFQILALTIHMQLYKLSLVYNSYCLQETERAWRWGNIYEKETEAWKSGFALFKFWSASTITKSTILRQPV